MNDRVHLVTIGGHRWLSPAETQEPDFRVAQGLAERLGGEHHVIARTAVAQAASVDRSGAVTVHRLDNQSAWSFARRARDVTRSLAASFDAPVVVTTSDVAGALAMWRPPVRVSVVVQVQGSVLDPGSEYGSVAKRFAIRTTMRMAVRRANAVRSVERNHCRTSTRGGCTRADRGDRQSR